MTEQFNLIFEELKAIMQPCADGWIVLHDEPGKYYLATSKLNQSKQPMWFGGVEIKKNYVSYHLMPIYCCPELTSTISPALKARMQGKSCFNFKKPAGDLLAELAALTLAGKERFKNFDPLKIQGKCS